MKTRHLRLVTHEHSVTITSRSNVSSPYGPVRAGLTTSQRTSEEVRLMELLNSLENVVHDLNYKSFTAYDTLVIATEGVRVALSAIVTDEAGTE